jgi:hypothetical protein
VLVVADDGQGVGDEDLARALRALLPYAIGRARPAEPGSDSRSSKHVVTSAGGTVEAERLARRRPHRALDVPS